MPEYLAPGVYVEEVDTGSKPIEGVSTSTTGMVGVTERGPVDVPVLITGVGEFNRWYGGLLRAADYGDHRYLPHAVEGFFTNGGKRVYVDARPRRRRVEGRVAALRPGRRHVDRDYLVRPAGEGTGSAASPPALVVLAVAGLADGDWIRIGDGSGAEYRQVDGAPAAETTWLRSTCRSSARTARARTSRSSCAPSSARHSRSRKPPKRARAGDDPFDERRCLGVGGRGLVWRSVPRRRRVPVDRRSAMRRSPTAPTRPSASRLDAPHAKSAGRQAPTCAASTSLRVRSRTPPSSPRPRAAGSRSSTTARATSTPRAIWSSSATPTWRCGASAS